jgi:hypothetical protein
MTADTCSTPGHEDKPVHSKGLCQACYRRKAREARGLQKPGPKPDPSKPFSRYNDETSHHNKRIKCIHGHFFDGVDDIGKQTCSICVADNLLTECPAGHEKNETNTSPSGSCRVCARERAVWYRYVAKYGLSQEQVTAVLEAQDYACAVCHVKFDMESKRPFDVDHDHSCCPGQVTCGKCVRGLVSPECNRGLGAFKDDVTILQSAIDYLVEHGA